MKSAIFGAVCAAAMAAGALLAAGAGAQAQQWPQRTVKLILPFGPGSGADTAARLLTEKLKDSLGQPVIIEGRPGGDALISVRAVVHGKDDHTLFFGPTSVFVVHPYNHDNLAYDPEKDLLPIAGVAKVMIAIAVPTALGVKDLKDFVARAKAAPEKISYGVAPGFSEFVFNGFLRENGLKIAKVPYRDITQSPQDVSTGRLQLSMLSYAAMRAQAQTGNLTVLAINDSARSAVAPTIPSVAEQGFPGLAASPALGLFGPREMTAQARARAAAAILEAMKDPAIVEGLNRSGQPAAAMGMEAFAAAVKEQHERVAQIAKVLGMKKRN